MSSSKKLFSHGWVLGVSLGLACSTGAVFAGNIATTYTPGQTLTDTMMTEIKTAVNDNDARVDGIQTGVPVCLTGMTRVGPLCVDTVRQAASSTWSDAVTTCSTAGKRLLTPSEYVAALNLAGTALGMDTAGQYEWVDSVASDARATDNTLIDGYAGRMTVGYMGLASGVTGVTDGVLFYANNIGYDVGDAIIYFRCAR